MGNNQFPTLIGVGGQHFNAVFHQRFDNCIPARGEL